MGEDARYQVAFPLRDGAAAELGRRKDSEHGPLARLPDYAAPQLCVAHGAAPIRSRQTHLKATPQTEYDRMSRDWKVLYHLTRHRVWYRRVAKQVTQPGHTFTVHMCGECRAAIWQARRKVFALLVLAVCMVVVIPRLAGVVGADLVGVLSVLGSLGVVVFAATRWPWIDDFSRASVSDDGAQLIYEQAHPDYARAALDGGGTVVATSPIESGRAYRSVWRKSGPSRWIFR